MTDLAARWGVTVTSTRETASSQIAFGHRGTDAVVLKVVKQLGDEWRAGEILEAFNGKGCVRVHAWVPGALLMERAMPGESLARSTADGDDDEATAIIAETVHRLSGRIPPRECVTVDAWGRGFDRYIASGERQISASLVGEARATYNALADTQTATQLLHGDLQHDNVLRDNHRGWLAIDPKGVVGEAEYEFGAMFRNPIERPELFVTSAAVDRRARHLARFTDLNIDRILRWAFAQAVLSAIWAIEDRGRIGDMAAAVALAETIRASCQFPQ